MKQTALSEQNPKHKKSKSNYSFNNISKIMSNISPKKFKNSSLNKLNKKDFFLTSNQNLIKKYLDNSSFHNSENKLTSLKKLLTNYNKIRKNDPFDGMVVNNKKPTVRDLLYKTSKKENKYCFEQNKLMKKPFPLLKFISNRKYYNNNSKLIIDLLTAKNGKLTKEQHNIIKYHLYKSLSMFSRNNSNNSDKKVNINNPLKNKNRTNILFKEYTKTGTNSDFNKNLIDALSEEKTHNKINTKIFEKTSNLFFMNKYLMDKIITKKDKEYSPIKKSFDEKKFIYGRTNNNNFFRKIGYSNDLNSPNYKVNKKDNATFYISLKKNKVKLFCHDVISNNISIINKRMLRLDGEQTHVKNSQSNYEIDDIIKDVSKQKVNNKLIKLLTNLKTL